MNEKIESTNQKCSKEVKIKEYEIQIKEYEMNKTLDDVKNCKTMNESLAEQLKEILKENYILSKELEDFKAKNHELIVNQHYIYKSISNKKNLVIKKIVEKYNKKLFEIHTDLSSLKQTQKKLKYEKLINEQEFYELIKSSK